MQQHITHLQIIYDNVYRQNAFVCIWSQIGEGGALGKYTGKIKHSKIKI